MANTGMVQDPQDMPCFLQNSVIQITLCPKYEAAKAENEYFFLTVTACNKLQNLLASDH
jgi:hypothetical protein